MISRSAAPRNAVGEQGGQWVFDQAHGTARPDPLGIDRIAVLNHVPHVGNEGDVVGDAVVGDPLRLVVEIGNVGSRVAGSSSIATGVFRVELGVRNSDEGEVGAGGDGRGLPSVEGDGLGIALGVDDVGAECRRGTGDGRQIGRCGQGDDRWLVRIHHGRHVDCGRGGRVAPIVGGLGGEGVSAQAHWGPDEIEGCVEILTEFGGSVEEFDLGDCAIGVVRRGGEGIGSRNEDRSTSGGCGECHGGRDGGPCRNEGGNGMRIAAYSANGPSVCHGASSRNNPVGPALAHAGRVD